MRKTEGRGLGFRDRLSRSRFADVARQVLPERAKKELRRYFPRERARYPQPEPVTVSLAGQEARFWIRNLSDWRRMEGSFEGPYGRALMQTLADRARPCFLDVGSAQGLYSILAAKAGCPVVAVDPDPISQASLRNNLSLNPDIASNVRIIDKALGDRMGEMTLHIDHSGAHAPSMRRTVPGLESTIQVPVVTMDKLVADGAIVTPDVVKIDVEGAEGLVIAGMQGVLSTERRPSDIFIELHEDFLKLFGSSVSQVTAAIIDRGYFSKRRWGRGTELLHHFSRC